MKRISNNIHSKLRIAASLWILAQTFVTSGQISSDLNNHIKVNDQTKTIVYTALRKGFTSVKAEVHLEDGELKCLDDQRFEDIYLEPLLTRYEENNGRIYQNYPGHFYLFIETSGDEINTLNALENVLSDYEDMIAGFRLNTQGNPLKVLVINPSLEAALELLKHESSLICLEGAYANPIKDVNYAKMPVVGMDYAMLEGHDLSGSVKKVHRQGKKIRLYNVPDDQSLWEALIRSGVDFINVQKPQQIVVDAR